MDKGLNDNNNPKASTHQKPNQTNQTNTPSNKTKQKKKSSYLHLISSWADVLQCSDHSWRKRIIF